ncbi:hypothetical protein TRFO_27290 [Tritrichomonas foetus]|uniref:C2 domain-containing protein n=1 Tax=Tritrichomonas foetus TaxID=1144522 RepID=A0A1J4K6N0_9EUKA|nr:hypothetical protein TRFO_27290 [Tritrichomonas foetus]|eukprot:OHT05109.1 hypothetical protein TRFO_27290 [Tritrichomonas foetus]
MNKKIRDKEFNRKLLSRFEETGMIHYLCSRYISLVANEYINYDYSIDLENHRGKLRDPREEYSMAQKIAEDFVIRYLINNNLQMTQETWENESRFPKRRRYSDRRIAQKFRYDYSDDIFSDLIWHFPFCPESPKNTHLISVVIAKKETNSNKLCCQKSGNENKKNLKANKEENWNPKKIEKNHHKTDNKRIKNENDEVKAKNDEVKAKNYEMKNEKIKNKKMKVGNPTTKPDFRQKMRANRRINHLSNDLRLRKTNQSKDTANIQPMSLEFDSDKNSPSVISKSNSHLTASDSTTSNSSNFIAHDSNSSPTNPSSPIFIQSISCQPTAFNHSKVKQIELTFSHSSTYETSECDDYNTSRAYSIETTEEKLNSNSNEISHIEKIPTNKTRKNNISIDNDTKNDSKSIQKEKKKKEKYRTDKIVQTSFINVNDTNISEKKHQPIVKINHNLKNNHKKTPKKILQNNEKPIKQKVKHQHNSPENVIALKEREKSNEVIAILSPIDYSSNNEEEKHFKKSQENQKFDDEDEAEFCQLKEKYFSQIASPTKEDGKFTFIMVNQDKKSDMNQINLKDFQMDKDIILSVDNIGNNDLPYNNKSNDTVIGQIFFTPDETDNSTNDTINDSNTLNNSLNNSYSYNSYAFEDSYENINTSESRYSLENNNSHPSNKNTKSEITKINSFEGKNNQENENTIDIIEDDENDKEHSPIRKVTLVDLSDTYHSESSNDIEIKDTDEKENSYNNKINTNDVPKQTIVLNKNPSNNDDNKNDHNIDDEYDEYENDEEDEEENAESILFEEEESKLSKLHNSLDEDPKTDNKSKNLTNQSNISDSDTNNDNTEILTGCLSLSKDIESIGSINNDDLKIEMLSTSSDEDKILRMHTLSVSVLEGKFQSLNINLPIFCVLSIDGQRKTTPQVKSNNPQWNSELEFRITNNLSLMKISIEDDQETLEEIIIPVSLSTNMNFWLNFDSNDSIHLIINTK